MFTSSTAESLSAETILEDSTKPERIVKLVSINVSISVGVMVDAIFCMVMDGLSSIKEYSIHELKYTVSVILMIHHCMRMSMADKG